MANVTQVRLQAITGSLVDITSGITSIAEGTAVGSLTATDIPDGEALLRYYAQAIANIHGQTAFGSNVPGRYVNNSGSGLHRLFPDTDAAITLGGGQVTSLSSLSGFDTSHINGSSLSSSDTSFTKTGSPTNGPIAANSYIVFTRSADSKVMVFRLTAGFTSSDSSMSVEFVPEASDIAGTVSKSGFATAIQQASPTSFISLEYQKVLTQEVRADSNLMISSSAGNIQLQGGAGVLDIDMASLDADFSGAAAINTSGDIDIVSSAGNIDVQVALGSEIGLADGVLTLDLDGTDVADGLLVDAEGSITLDAAHNSDAAMILNAAGSSGVIQMQNQGSAKLLVSGSEVRSNVALRAIAGTASTSTSTGALQVVGGVGISEDLFVGDDLSLSSDDAILNLGAGNDGRIVHSNGEQAVLVQAQGSGWDLVLSSSADQTRVMAGASGTGHVYLSGSSGLEFAADGNFSFSGHSDGGVLLMDAASEAATYRSNFSATTSIMAAINSLKSLGTPTLWRRVHSGADISAGAAVALTKVAGDATSFSLDLKANEADVYVNGQLVLSGSETERNNGSVDYNLGPAADQIKFGFPIVDGDVITLVDRT